MLDHNPILQMCSILGVIAGMLALVASMIPALQFEEEFQNPNYTRVVLLIFVLGCLPGVF